MARNSTVLITGCVAVFGLVIFRQIRVYRWGRCRSKASMRGKTVIITGANSGIGKATALELVRRGARVIMACRDFGKLTEAAEDIRQKVKGGELVAKRLDLASLKSVRCFVEDFIRTESKCHILINNAGIFQCPFMMTDDGFEMQMGVNHLGHFLLTVLLLETLKKSAPSRVIVVTSTLFKYGSIDLENLNPKKDSYNKRTAYANSKLANVLFARELDQIVKDSKIGVYTVTPGHVWTNLGRHLNVAWWKMMLLLPMAYLFVRTPTQGCQTIVNCAVDEKLEGVSGKFYRDCKEQPWDEKVVNSQSLGNRLWNLSQSLTDSPPKTV